MLEAKLQNAVILKRVFEAMACLVNEVNLDCDESGLKLQAMDQSHVALVSLRLEDVGFLHYRCDRPRSLGLNISSVVKVFKLCSPQDTVSIQNEDEGDTITFVFENNAEEKTSTFGLRLMCLDQESLGLPDEEEGEAEIKLSAKEYACIVNTIKELSDTVKIQVQTNAVKFVTCGDLGSAEILLKQRDRHTQDEQDCGVDIKVHHPVSQTYAVKYLVFFSKAACLSSFCSLSLSSNRPICIKFDILDTAQGESRNSFNKLGGFKFYLAPKMQDDEEDIVEEENTEKYKNKNNVEDMQTEDTCKNEGGQVKPEETADI